MGNSKNLLLLECRFYLHVEGDVCGVVCMLRVMFVCDVHIEGDVSVVCTLRVMFLWFVH